jgi:hypothetical protein
MVAITATNSATPSLQASLNQSRLEQARRDADQAEANAQQLRKRADEAEQDSEKNQQNVRELAARGRQLDSTYTTDLRARRTSIPLPTDASQSVTPDSRFISVAQPGKTNSLGLPVLNLQNKAIGQNIDTTA